LIQVEISDGSSETVMAIEAGRPAFLSSLAIKSWFLFSISPRTSSSPTVMIPEPLKFNLIPSVPYEYKSLIPE
jgi:hypothetical protein